MLVPSRVTCLLVRFAYERLLGLFLYSTQFLKDHSFQFYSFRFAPWWFSATLPLWCGRMVQHRG